MLLPTTKNWLYLNNSLQISCNSTSWIRLLVKILVFISCHRKSERILENIFCPRSILSSPNTLFPQNIPFSNKLQGSAILYLIISIDETNNCLQIFPVNLATITGNLPFCDISQKFFENYPPNLIISIDYNLFFVSFPVNSQKFPVKLSSSLTISIDESNYSLQIFPVNLAKITGNLPFCDIFNLTEIFLEIVLLIWQFQLTTFMIFVSLLPFLWETHRNFFVKILLQILPSQPATGAFLPPKNAKNVRHID